MILKNVKKTTGFFTLKGYSTVYRVINHFPDNRTLIESTADGRQMSVPSDKVIELVKLETL